MIHFVSNYFLMSFVLNVSILDIMLDLTDMSSVSHLFRGKNRDEVLIYLADFLFNHSLIGFFFQLFAGEPEHHVLFAELSP